MSVEKLRLEMVERQIKERGISDDNVLSAMALVPRELFVPEDLRQHSYYDGPLPIDCAQTISQPFITAYMAEALKLEKSDKVLEIGTGSGYNAAVLSELAGEVYTVEIIKALADDAQKLLNQIGYKNIHIKHGDGREGWAEEGPYDAIILTAAPVELPTALLDQLKVGGRLIAPVGSENQNLYLYRKYQDRIDKTLLIPVRFIPLVDEQYLRDKEIIR